MITTDYVPIKYAGDGVQKEFSITFKFPDIESIKISTKDLAGTVVDLVHGVDFTITNVNSSGPTYARVDFVVAPASGVEVVVYADSEFRQETEYKNTGSLDMTVLMKNLDDLTLYLQQLKNEISRSVRVGIASGLDPAQLISDIETQAAQVGIDAVKVDQAVSQMFQRVIDPFITTPGQTDYTIPFPVDPNLYNVQVFLNGIKQGPKTAFTLPDTTTIRFSVDPGAKECVIESSLSYANPDLNVAISSAVTDGKQQVQEYTDNTAQPQIADEVVKATEQADRSESIADSLSSIQPQIDELISESIPDAVAPKMGEDNHILVVDEKASGISGGSFTANTWTTRILNTVKHNTIIGASLNISNSRITLPAGTYYVECSAPTYASNQHKLVLQNVTSPSVLIEGTSEFNDATGSAQTRAKVVGYITLAAATNLEMQQRTASTTDNNGMGVQSNIAGVVEIYSIFEAWKVD